MERYIHTNIPRYIYLHKYIHTHIYIHIYTYTYIHTHTYTHICTYIHTHTHTHTLSLSLSFSLCPLLFNLHSYLFVHLNLTFGWLTSTRDLPIPIKTLAGSAVATCWRITLMPVDTTKTILQVMCACQYVCMCVYVSEWKRERERINWDERCNPFNIHS